MRAHVLKGALALTPGPDSCTSCTTDGHRRLFDVLVEATALPHASLHTMQAQSKTLADFRRKMDFFARARGKTIDWNAPIPKVP